MKVYKRIVKILGTLVLLVVLFIIIHVTPSISIRSRIFFSGHLIAAFKGSVKVNKYQYEMDKDILNKENAMIYNISGCNIYYKDTGNVISNYKVEKVGFLYFAKEYGEA